MYARTHFLRGGDAFSQYARGGRALIKERRRTGEVEGRLRGGISDSHSSSPPAYTCCIAAVPPDSPFPLTLLGGRSGLNAAQGVKKAEGDESRSSCAPPLSES